MPFINPENVIKSIGVELGMQVADFGSGPGFYSIPLAKAVGPNGRVYALDVQKSMLELVRSKARQARLLNIVTMWADLETARGSGLAENTVEVVIISNILFQAENKKEMLTETFRILKPGGKIAVIEWDSSAGGTGPTSDKIVKREVAETLLVDTGFTRKKEFYAGDNHYGLLYGKPK